MQRKSSMQRKLINPASMSKAESIFAGLILDYYSKGNFTSFTTKELFAVEQKLCPDSVPDDVKQLFADYTHIQFACELSATKSDRSYTGICYYLLDDRRKYFHNSIFRNVAGVLQPQPDGSLVFKSHKDRIAKCWQANKNEALQENELTRRQPLLAAKPLSSLRDKPTDAAFKLDRKRASRALHVMVMRNLPGKDLQDYLFQELQGEQVFTLDQRLLLSRQLIKALIEQVQMNNVIHRDISMHNIRVDISRPDLPVVIFDFGTSIDKTIRQNNATLYGTPIFMSPEVYDMEHTGFPADIYSMAWVLALLWHADGHPIEDLNRKYMKKHLKTYEVYQVQMKMKECLIDTAHDCHFKNFFKGIHGLSLEHRKLIANMIQRMVHPVTENRPMAEDVLTCFDDIISARRINKLPKQLREPAHHAHQQGRSLRYELQIKEWQYNGAVMLREVASAIRQALERIDNHPAVINELLDAAALDFLKGLTTKVAITTRLDEMQDKMDCLYTAFTEIKAKSCELLSGMSDSWTANQQNQIRHIANRVALVEKKYAEPKNQQELLVAIPKLDKYVNTLTLEIDQLCSMKVTGPSLHSPTCM